MKRGLCLVALGAIACSSATARSPGSRDRAPGEQLAALLLESDRDGDGRISERDERGGTPLRFTAEIGGRRIPLQGQARLAHLADLLARDAAGIEPFDPARIDDTPEEVVRGLADRSWTALVRRSDRLAALVPVLRGSRLQAPDGVLYVYYPDSDREAATALTSDAVRFPEVVLVALPRRLDAAWLERLDRQPGLLYLPRPYIVPGGRFVEMYGWDSYFMARGALAAGRVGLARDLLDDLLYQIERYGKIGNSNRSYHRGRSQPPFLTRLALELAPHLRVGERAALLRRTAAAGERELAEVWLAPPRITDTGLSRYHDEARGAPPEVVPGRYQVWRDQPAFYDHQRAVRESGWDMTNRFDERGHLIAPVCLNALLYGYQRDMAEIYRQLDGPGSRDAVRHEAAAARHKERIDRFLWDPARGLYFDWDVEKKARTDYESMAGFYPLFVGLASPEQARAVVASLDRFLAPGGIAVSSRASREAAGGEQLQWDWPFGWAPLQIIAVEGLRRYGYAAEADDLSVRWLSLVIEVAIANNGLIVEKYDVAHRTGNVPVEYGNQGGDRGPLARYRDTPGCRRAPRPRSCLAALLIDDLAARTVGFGWTNASVAILLDGLGPEAKSALASRLR